MTHCWSESHLESEPSGVYLFIIKVTSNRVELSCWTFLGIFRLGHGLINDVDALMTSRQLRQ